MKLRRHPQAEALQKWLDGGGSAETDAHLATCTRCADTLESLDEDTDPFAEPSAVSHVLTEALEPPKDLTDRLEKRVVARLNSKELLGVFADLFGAGLETSKLLFTEEPP